MPRSSGSFPPEKQTDMNNTSTQRKSGTDWQRLRRMKDADIDFSDVPPVDRSVFKKMAIRMPEKKSALSLRLDPGVIAWFRKQGRGYQTRINAVLRSYVEAHSHCESERACPTTAFHVLANPRTGCRSPEARMPARDHHPTTVTDRSPRSNRGGVYGTAV
jgi:uncharacterized protein (DUF4415 family)